MTRRAVTRLMGAGLVLFLGAAIGSAAGDQDQALGEKVLDLMKRSLATELPEELPRSVTRRMPEDAVRDYEEYHRFQPGEAFFFPHALRRQDPKLCRGIKRFWTLKPSRQIQVVPFLGERYVQEERALQRLILEVIGDVTEDAFDVEGRDALVEPVYLKILQGPGPREDRLWILQRRIGTLEISAAGARQLLELAGRWGHADPELRAALVGALADGENFKAPPPEEVGRFVLDVAENDPCQACRRAAIIYSMQRHLGRRAVLPTYLRVLDRAVAEGDASLANAAILVVGIKWEEVTAVPHLIRALDAKDAYTRALVITALENVAMMDMVTIPKDVQIFSIDYDKPRLDAEVMATLERAASRWKTWWSDVGEEALSAVSPDAFRQKARQVYSPPSPG